MIRQMFQSKHGTLLFVVIGYFAVHASNSFLTGFLQIFPGTHLVFIPSGFKLLFVLIAGWTGAIGLAVAVFMASVLYKFPGEFLLSFELSLMNAIAPLLAIRWGLDKLSLNDDLSNITLKQLSQLGFMFAFFNSTLTQSVLFWNEIHHNFIEGILVMFIGDITGAFIVLIFLKRISKKLIDIAEANKK